MTPTQFKNIRLKLGMNTTELAYHLPCVERHIRRMEKGERGITQDTITRMEELLDMKKRGKL